MMITTYYPTLENKFSKHFQRDPTVPSSPSMEQHSNVHVEVKRRTTQWIQVFQTQTLSCLPYILICCHLLLFSCPLSICVLCAIGDAGPLTHIYLLHTCRNYGPLLCRPSPLSLALVALPLSLPLWKLILVPLLTCNSFTHFWSHYSIYSTVYLGPGWKRKYILFPYSYESTN
jgi:hypothetical protein